MTPLLTQKPKSRRFAWLIAIVVLVFAAYSAGWFYLARKVRAEVDGAIAGLAAQGIRADCANMAVGGYPIRLVVSCDSVAYEDDAGNVAASSGAVTAAAPFYLPLSPGADITGPLRTSAPGMAPLWLDWDRMHVSTGLMWPAQRRLALQAEGFSGQTDPQDDSDPVQLFSAAKAKAQVRPAEDQDLDVRISFGELQVDAEAIDGRTLPPLDGMIEATVKNGMALLATQVESLRGQSLTLRQVALSSGTAAVQVSGPVAVRDDGLIDADLMIRIKDPQTVATILATAIPEQERQIQQGFAALAFMGKEPSMPLKIAKGRISLGFIPLGKIGPVE